YDSATNTGNMQELVKAENAKVNVKVIDIERQSNTVTVAPQGITLTLPKKVTDATVTGTKDDTRAKEAIKS
ncbi:flagellar filament capping protein FliD, partial [Salmonella enterica]|uniref:flagellar filament capping protein FliD n=1 Tax=Salmonella enterica TaxID=28901 RepID=UPI0032982BD9